MTFKTRADWSEMFCSFIEQHQGGLSMQWQSQKLCTEKAKAVNFSTVLLENLKIVDGECVTDKLSVAGKAGSAVQTKLQYLS